MTPLITCLATCTVLLSVFGQTVGISSTIDQLQSPKKCSLERIAKMSGYTCAGMNYNDVPKNLKTGIEVIFTFYTTTTSIIQFIPDSDIE